jgi:hypothetical protein
MRALSQIGAGGVERPWLPRSLPELLDANSQPADDVTDGKGGLHGCRCQAAFKII